MNVSIYGMCVEVPVDLPVGTEVTVQVNGVEIRSAANVRYSLRSMPQLEWWFKIGLEFRKPLLGQDIPDLDAVLMQSLRYESGNTTQVEQRVPKAARVSLMSCFRIVQLPTAVLRLLPRFRLASNQSA